MAVACGYGDRFIFSGIHILSIRICKTTVKNSVYNASNAHVLPTCFDLYKFVIRAGMYKCDE